MCVCSFAVGETSNMWCPFRINFVVLSLTVYPISLRKPFFIG